MKNYQIEGGNKVYGEVNVSAAKNSVLPIACASLLLRGETFICGCPKIGDVTVLCKILEGIGVKTDFRDGGLYLNTKNVVSTNVARQESCKIRASFFLAGPLIAKYGSVTVSKPGGCKIGERGVDIHLDGLCALGAKVEEKGNCFTITAKRLKGSVFHLRYPSVGATENLILAASLADGVTVIENCAKEPEVKDLCDFLNLCGAKIKGGGTNVVQIVGVEKLTDSVSYKPIPDRIETGTFLSLCYLVGGKLEIRRESSENIYYLAKKICDNSCQESGFYVNIYSDKIYIQSNGEPKGLGSLVTGPYPMFPTDLHPIVAAVGAAAKGKTTIVETVFDSRFAYLDGLKKMGANFTVCDNSVTFLGKSLKSAIVEAPDLRGGAGLVIAALKAEGVSTVKNADLIMRGYEDFSKKLSRIGAKIKITKG